MKNFFRILFLAVITAGALLAILKQAPGGGMTLFSSSGQDLPERLLHFRPDEVRKIIVSWQEDNSVTLFLDKENRWRLAERKSCLASASRINGILSSLSTLAPLKRIEDSSPEMLRELSLREKAGKTPADKIPPGILVRLFGNTDKEIDRLLLGSGHFPPAVGNTRESTLPRARYVKTSDGKIYLVSQVFEELLPIPMAYIEPFAVRNMERALWIACYRNSEKVDKLLWCAGRKGSSQAFRTVYPKDKSIVQQKLAALAQLFSKQMTLDLITEHSGKKEKKMILRLSDGFEYQLQFYREKGQIYMEVGFVFREKAVHPYPGENPEHYRKRIGALKLRDAYEKQYFHGKTFLVRPDIGEKLLQEPFASDRKLPRKKSGGRK